MEEKSIVLGMIQEVVKGAISVVYNDLTIEECEAILKIIKGRENKEEKGVSDEAKSLKWMGR